MSSRRDTALRARLIAGACLLGLLCSAARAQYVPETDPIIDWRMDPHLSLPPGPVEISAPLLDLWKQALSQPENEARRLTLSAILQAHKLGVRRFDALLPQLEVMLAQDDLPPVLRVDIARVLITLDDRKATPQLLDLDKSGNMDLVLVIDPCLARWHCLQAVELWRARLDDPALLHVVRVSAMNALGDSGDASGAPRLREIVLDAAADPTERLAAARVLGRVESSGMDAVALELLQRPSATGVDSAAAFERLLAASVLGDTRNDQSKNTLLALAQDQDATVAAESLRQLVAWDPKSIQALAPELLKNPDATVRYLTVTAQATTPASSSVTLLAPLLNDLVPAIRTSIRRYLIACGAEPALKPQVLNEARAALASSDWRAQEQGAFLVGTLDDKDPATVQRLEDLVSAPKQLEDLRSTSPQASRFEVRLAAIVALRWLNLPQTFPGILDHAQILYGWANELLDKIREEDVRLRETKSTHITTVSKPQNPAPSWRRLLTQADIELAASFEALGAARYTPARPLALSWIPGSPLVLLMTTTRQAAFWAVGQLYTNTPDRSVVGKLYARAADVGDEAPPICIEAAMALQQMGATDSVERAVASIRKQGFFDVAGKVELATHPAAPRLPPPLETRSDVGFLVPLAKP